jgi:predicted nucleic acid-binding protein
MNQVVVDSNIIFSSLLSKNSSIREKLANNNYSFCAPKFLFVEIFKHKERILNRSSATEDEVLEFLQIALHNIHFITEDLISTSVYIHAYELCKDVDEKDTPFVALALELGCPIWTRDEELKSGLILKGFNRFISENQL